MPIVSHFHPLYHPDTYRACWHVGRRRTVVVGESHAARMPWGNGRGAGDFGRPGGDFTPHKIPMKSP
jgi:hypothetical protein